MSLFVRCLFLFCGHVRFFPSCVSMSLYFGKEGRCLSCLTDVEPHEKNVSKISVWREFVKYSGLKMGKITCV